MSMLKDEQIHEAVIDRASGWYVRHREGGLTAAEKDEFLAWLRASPQHAGEYLAIARMAGGLRAAIADLGWDESRLREQLTDADDNGRVVDWPRVALIQKRRSAPMRRVILPLLAASIVAACGLYWFMPPGFMGLARSVSVGHGEQRTVQLQDGSLIHVNASSKVRIRYSRSERLVELDEGQALFNVAHDKRRPFRVRAGITEVTAIGTQFDVYRQASDKVTVTVVQGRVDVVEHEPLNLSGSARHTAAPIEPIRLNAGQQVQLGLRQAAPKTESVDVRAATAWVRREIIFEGRPLREVTEEFNRYVPVPIEIDDAALRELKVSGIFNAYDSESFLVFLHQYNVDVSEGVDTIHVRRKATRE